MNLDATLGQFRDIRFSAGISGIPLLTLPKSKRVPYLESILDRLVPGGIVTQLSYSFLPPQDAVPGRLTVDKSKWVTANLPPGRDMDLSPALRFHPSFGARSGCQAATVAASASGSQRPRRVGACTAALSRAR